LPGRWRSGGRSWGTDARRVARRGTRGRCTRARLAVHSERVELAATAGAQAGGAVLAVPRSSAPSASGAAAARASAE
jgi:hypothetical protein